MMFAELLVQKGAEAGYAFSDKQVEQFALYFERLIETNKVMNLTAITDPQEVVVKHMIDSLTVYQEKYFTKPIKLCDVGSGAGFPGLPLKIYKPELNVTLLDSLAKRLKFLNGVIEELALQDIKTCHVRAEDAGHLKEQREKYDVVVARAVASLAVLCEYCLPLVRVGGIFAAMKGKQWEQELSVAGKAISKLGGELLETKKITLPGLTDERAIIFIAKKVPTPKAYPRKAGLPERVPLI